VAAWFYMKGDCLVPADADALRGVRRLGEGECVEVNIVRPRSLQWHRMYKAICAEIGKNQEPRRDGDSIDYELRILAGHYDVLPVHGHEGVEIRTPKRIAFAKLSADKWSDLWPSLELAIRQRFGEGYIEEGRKRA
jgi:hypothetical protein